MLTWSHTHGRYGYPGPSLQTVRDCEPTTSQHTRICSIYTFLKILIDIGHPAHVHIFRNLAKELEKDGHTVLFTCREKECTLDLLKAYRLTVIMEKDV